MKRIFVLIVAVMTLFGSGAAGLMAQKKSPEAQFSKMDKNGDNKLSPEELVAGKKADKAKRPQKRFKKLDKDNDGFLSLDEFKAAGKRKKLNG